MRNQAAPSHLTLNDLESRAKRSGWCVAGKEDSSLPDEKIFVRTLCARSVKLQEQSFTLNNFRASQTKVSRTIISEFTEIQDYSEVNIAVIPHYFGCEFNSVWVNLRACAVLLFLQNLTIWPCLLYCSSNSCILCNYRSTVILKINSLTFLWRPVIFSGTHKQRHQGA